MNKIPENERPRERLYELGPDALSLTELLAILLVTGTKDKTVLELSSELTIHFGGLPGLIDASISELMQIKGIGRARAIQLKAVFGLVSRAQKTGDLKLSIQTPAQAYSLVKDELASQKKEMLVVILKDIRHRLIRSETVSMGTLSQALAHPREIFYPAVKHAAHSFILAHNHPSGDPTPSKADIELTHHLLHSSKVMGIPLDDHIIVGASSYFSLKEQGFI